MSTQPNKQRNMQRGAVDKLLVTGIALPIVLILLFWAAIHVPRWITDPPQYDLLYTAYDSNFQFPAKIFFEYKVDSEKLVVDLQPAADRYRSPRRLYRYDARTQESKVVALDNVFDSTIPNAVTPDALRSARISDSKTAPDGYRFVDARGGSGGLFGGVFFSRRRGSQGITNNGATYAIDEDGLGRYGNMMFVGWIIDED